jgi:hypothetical protein
MRISAAETGMVETEKIFVSDIIETIGQREKKGND